MLDFNHILSTPGYDLQQFSGSSTTTLTQWQTWRKPRGVTWVYILAVGGGGGGSTGGRGASTTASGGGGGGSGAQTTLFIPAMFVPDLLYIQTGNGGAGITTSGGTGVAGNPGQPTYVCIEPDTTLTPQMTLVFAGGGGAGGAEATTGSTGGTGGTLGSLSNMPLAGKGIFTAITGQGGGTGGNRVVTPAAANITYFPGFGSNLMVSSGAGGGGTTGSAFGAGGNVQNGGVIGLDTVYVPTALLGGAAASGSTPAGKGAPGYASKNYVMYLGGCGGGSSSTTAGGTAGSGGDGAPGCGGGGAGAITSFNTQAVRSGYGGAGFVYIISV